MINKIKLILKKKEHLPFIVIIYLDISDLKIIVTIYGHYNNLQLIIIIYC